MTFLLNGSTASIAPFRQQWIDIITGIDSLGRPVLAAAKQVRLEFDRCSTAMFSQWAALNATSLVSVTLLNMDGSSYTTYNNSNIYFSISERPAFEDANVSQWSALLNGIIP